MLDDSIKGPEIEPYQKSFSESNFLPLNSPYAVILIGMDLTGMKSNDYNRLYSLINGADSVVVGFAVCWEGFERQFEEILKNTNKKVAQRVILDLSNNDFGDLTGSWPVRSMRIMFLLK